MAIALRFLFVATFLFLLTSWATASSGVHDLLEQFGFPKGLLPHSAENYTLADDGSFEVRLEHPCYVKFSELVHYADTITGNISFGSFSGIEGILIRKYLTWFPISIIKADQDFKTILIQMGMLSENHPWGEFEDVRDCQKKRLQKASYRRNADLLPEELFAAAEV